MRRFARLSPHLLADLCVIALLFLLPLIVFWSQTLGGKTLLPGENLYQYSPYAAQREQNGVPLPYNGLVSDLVLENLQWKAFIRQNLAQGEFPLWNPMQFSGIPFFAAGQQSTLYPFSLLYYLGDEHTLYAAYGWFTVVQLWLAGTFMFGFTRRLGIGRGGAAAAGVVYQLSAFFIISAVFPMIIASAVWLPLLLWMIENILRNTSLRRRPAIPVWAAIGAIGLGCNILAGHVEITYYTLLIAGGYAAVRLLVGFATARRARESFSRAAWLVGMVVLGLALGAVQFLPLFEHASTNFRAGSATLSDIRAWAHPPRDIAQFLLPNLYGSPAWHQYTDLFSGQTVDLDVTPLLNAAGQPFRTIDWGIKNYVEGALYVGILPLLLAVYGLLARTSPPGSMPLISPGGVNRRAYQAIFGALGLLSLSFMFGLPTYQLLLWLPGISQLHSPFRWVFALTLSVAVLAGFGADALLRARAPSVAVRDAATREAGGGGAVGGGRPWARRIGLGLIGLGVLIVIGLIASRAGYDTIAPLVERVFAGMAKADQAYTDARMFFSVTAGSVFVFALAVIGAGAAFVFRRAWLIVAVIALDLMAASWGFNPASDPAWLDFKPDSIAWLQQRAAESAAQGEAWRYTALVDPTQANPDLFQANLTMRYGIEDVRGYESIIPRTYVEVMQGLAPQVQLDYNRIAPLYTAYDPPFEVRDALTSPRLNALGVRYVVTQPTTDLSAVPGYSLAYEGDGVRIWQNAGALPRAYRIDSGLLASATQADDLAVSEALQPLAAERTAAREWLVRAVPAGDQTLMLAENSAAGWRAFARSTDAAPPGEPLPEERPLPVTTGYNGQIAVELGGLPSDTAYDVRIVYSPQSFNIGLFASFTGVLIGLLLVGGWGWRSFVFPSASEGVQVGGLQRVARNSAAPIVLNLFNRGIDFAFAFVMLRVLGPEGAGAYYYAGVIFVWFDILTNFGLNLYLTREVARDRARAAEVFLNTSVLRVGLAIAGIPALILFLLVRQSSAPPLGAETVIAIGLLYVGLLPNSLSTGLTALFYAHERAEMPAVTATVATLCKAVFGLVALILGWGIVGLAAVSIITNGITLGLLAFYGRDMLRGLGRARVQGGVLRAMVGESRFLMLNHLLATIFFQIDVVLIEFIRGTRMVGLYSVAYKWVSALNIIPSFFTQALLPILARQAHQDRDALARNYALAIKLLISVAFPVAVVFTFSSSFLVNLLGGAEYLPDSAIATQIMMWSIPIGWMNSLTQYVLIALDLHRRITRAFVVAVAFNLIANIVFIPQFGYIASALISILSEAVLFVFFARLLERGAGETPGVGPVAWWGLFGKPALAAVAMLLTTLVTTTLGLAVLPALIVGGAVYAAAWVLLRVFSAEEWARLTPLLPGRVRATVTRLARG